MTPLPNRLAWLTLIGALSSLPAIGAEALSVYRIVPANASALAQIAQKFEITSRAGTAFEVIIPAERRAELAGLARDLTLVDPDLTASLKAAERGFVGRELSYHQYDEVVAESEQLAKQYPKLVQLVKYGVSQQGRPLFALKVSDHVAVDEAEPEMMITAATHGNELMTVEVLLGVLKRMLKGYGLATAEGARVTQMINDRELYFIPMVNPDGFAARQRHDNGKDPNRSYPYPDDPQRVPTPSIGPLIQFFQSRQFAATLDLHTSGQMVMYPWGYTEDRLPPAEDAKFAAFAERLAEPVHYVSGPIATTIYVAPGSSCDYYYLQRRIPALTIEIGSLRLPPPEQIPDHIDDLKEPIWRFVEGATAVGLR